MNTSKVLKRALGKIWLNGNRDVSWPKLVSIAFAS